MVVVVARLWVVPDCDPFEDGGGGLVAGVPVVLVEELELKDREERFSNGVVETIADRSHRSEQASISESLAEEP